MQRVQTLACWVAPEAVIIWTRFRLGSQRRRLLLLAWETLLPVAGPLPQISQTFAMIEHLGVSLSRALRGSLWNVYDDLRNVTFTLFSGWRQEKSAG
jgi:hypothetical protein